MGEKGKVPKQKLLSIRLLGPPEVSVEGRPLRFGTKKSLALLCYLAVEGGRHPRRELAELLWPESDERHARTDLRSALAKLRKTLGEGSAPADGHEEGVRFLVVDGAFLEIERQGNELDLERLEAAVSLARSKTSPGGMSADAVGRRELTGRLRGELGLYRGEFMEGFSLDDAPEFELWLEGERARWRRVFGELCERLSRLQGEAGQPEEAIETARLWARQVPLEEAAHRRLVELLSAAGDSAGALLAYEDFRDALSRELRSEPSPQMQELAGRLQEEVEARSSLGASLAPAEGATPLSVLEVPLADRNKEFGALVSEYRAARAGQTRVAVVLGEEGIGKTRLVSEFLLWARARGADVLKGGASEGAGLPYGPLVEAIRPRIEREKAPDDLLEDVWLSELTRLLPELKERYPDLHPPPSGEREMAKGALFEAIARLVGTLASSASVVLFLDDLEWADAATLEVLDYASKRWAEQGAPVLLLIAARLGEPEVSSYFERWLASLVRRLPVRSLTLGPLKDEDVRGLLGRLGRADSKSAGTLEEPAASYGTEPPGLEGFGEWLAAETGGQPFYLVETLKALIEEGELVIRSRADGERVVGVGPAMRAGSDSRGLLPTNVREVIRARLSHLSPSASELLRAGAVLETGFDFDSLVGVAGLGEAEGLRGLDELLERRLLEEEAGSVQGLLLDPSPTYSFAHEKIRQVAYTEGGHARRRVLHHRALEVLEERGAPPADLARHALAGGLAEQAFRYSVAAGDQALEVFAVNDAIEHYERARNLLAEVRAGGRHPTEPPIPDLEHLYIQLGRAYEMVDEWSNARAAYEALLELGRELGEARLEVVSLNHLAVLAYHQSDVLSVRTLLNEARQVSEEAGLVEALAETECNLADVMTFWVGESEHSRPLAQKALASARALERPDLVARALVALARVEVFRGRLEESAAYAEEGAALSRQLADDPQSRTILPTATSAITGLAASWKAGHKAIEIQCLTYLAYARIYQGRLQEGLAIGREAHAISRELPERIEAMSAWALSLGLVEIGEYEEALMLARRGVELARKAQDTYLLAVNLDRLGRAHEALLNLEKARAAYAEPLGQEYEPWSDARLCVVAALSENWEEAYAHAKRANEAHVFANNQPLSIHLHHEVEALLRGGDEGLAREEVSRFAERAQKNERDRIAYLRSLAILGAWEGDPERATAHLREAVELAEKLWLPGELWRIRAALGKLYERRGDPGEARIVFSQAAQTLTLLAQKIGDQELRESFLSAPQARRVFERS